MKFIAFIEKRDQPDVMIAPRGKLFVSLKDGNLLCMEVK